MSETKTVNPTTTKRKKVRPGHLGACLVLCLLLWVLIFTARATGDLSFRLSLVLSGAVLSAGSFYYGTIFGGVKHE